MLPEAEEIFDHREAGFDISEDFDVDVDSDLCLSSGAAVGHGSKRTLGGETDMHVAPDFPLNRTLEDSDVCRTSGVPAGGHGSKHTRDWETGMNNASDKMPRLAPTVKRHLSGEGRAGEDTESSSGNAYDMVLQQQGEGRSKRPRTGAAAHEKTQGVNGSSRRADDMQSNSEVSLEADVAEDVELRLRVLNKNRQETEVVTQVGVDTVDLSAHTRLLALPEALRGLTEMRELTVASTALYMLPEWLGELRGLEVLQVGGTEDVEDDTCFTACPLRSLPGSIGALTGLKSLHLRYMTLTALPESLGALTGLTTLNLSGCDFDTIPAILAALTGLRTLDLGKCLALTALPASLGALTGLEDLELAGCSQLVEVPAWVMGLHKLKVPFKEVRLRVMRGGGGGSSDKESDSEGEEDFDVFHSDTEIEPFMEGEGDFDVFDSDEEIERLIAEFGRESTRVEVVTHVRVDKVDLSAHVGLLALPEALRDLTSMWELTVVSKVLQTLPEWLGELHGLEVLHVGGTTKSRGWDVACPLNALPVSLGALTALKMLDLSLCCALTALPSSLVALTGLTTLDLRGCEALTALPEWLGALTGLETLILSNCYALMALPASLGALTGLETLNLRNCYALMALPESMGALTSLTTLDLNCCKATALPVSFGAMTGLTTLDLGGCKAFAALPESLGALTGLTTLDMEFCSAFTALPVLFGALTRLTTLDLRGCEALTALPASFGALTGLTTLDLSRCEALTALPVSFGAMTGLISLDLGGCKAFAALPESLGALMGLKTLDLSNCYALMALPASLGALTGLWRLNLSNCYALMALPASLGALTGLRLLELGGCHALHTPPLAIVEAGTRAVQQFLRDLAKGEAPSHLIKVVLLGNQRAGKSSLADSLVLGWPATRADNDRTVGIEVRRWRLGGQSPLVANIFDAAGQRVYRATHGFFMSPGALFLHVVRCDMPEDAAVAALLAWVDAVQQEAPGAVMSLVWTHTDIFDDSVCGGPNGQEGFLRVVGGAGGETVSWIAMRYIQQLVGAPCVLKDVGIVKCRSLGKWKEKHGDVEVQRRVGAEDVRGMVAVFDVICMSNDIERCTNNIKAYVLDLQSRGFAGVLVIVGWDSNSYKVETILRKLCSSLRTVADIIPIMLILNSDAGALACPEAKLTAFPGWLLTCCRDVYLYLPGSCASSRGAL